MATQLNWRPDGGIVAFVPEDTLPAYDLPSEATRIQLDGKPVFHVTLIGRRVMEPYKEEMATLWPAIAAAAPEPPVAQLSLELMKACDEEKAEDELGCGSDQRGCLQEVSSRPGGSDRSSFSNRGLRGPSSTQRWTGRFT